MAVYRMKHLVEIVQPLGIRAEQMRHHTHTLAQAYFTLV